MTARGSTRRTALLATLSALPATLLSQEQRPPDESFRYRWTTLDALFEKARTARKQKSIPLSAYATLVKLLHEEEETIFRQASAHTFQDITESNFWRRGKLKFPSSLQTESRLLAEGKDPAQP